MSFQVGVLEALGDHGVNFREYPGCRTRGYSSFWPLGHIVHHDAIAARWVDPCPSIFADGRPDLAGPITNFATAFTGLVWVIALGAANHAGAGWWNGIVGNSKLWGNENQNAGDDRQVYPDEQIESNARLGSALCDYSGFDPADIARHAEYALPRGRKIDALGPWEDGHRWQFDMGHFRALVAEGGDMGLTPEQNDMLVAIHQELMGQPTFGYPKLRDAAVGVWIAKVKGDRQGWVTNGIFRSPVRKGLGNWLNSRGVPRVEITKDALEQIPVAGS